MEVGSVGGFQVKKGKKKNRRTLAQADVGASAEPCIGAGSLDPGIGAGSLQRPVTGLTCGACSSNSSCISCGSCSSNGSDEKLQSCCEKRAKVASVVQAVVQQVVIAEQAAAAKKRYEDLRKAFRKHYPKGCAGLKEGSAELYEWLAASNAVNAAGTASFEAMFSSGPGHIWAPT